jgi:hypothetical protein
MTGRSVSAVTAYTAHREWASRPPDERYASVHALYEAARARRRQLEERTIETGEFRTEAVDDDLAFRESSGRTATLTHWSFGQLATIAGAPPNYLRSLPASIASSAINYGLSRIERAQHQLFVADTAPWTVHAITSPRYARVHHDELASRVGVESGRDRRVDTDRRRLLAPGGVAAAVAAAAVQPGERFAAGLAPHGLKAAAFVARPRQAAAVDWVDAAELETEGSCARAIDTVEAGIPAPHTDGAGSRP